MPKPPGTYVQARRVDKIVPGAVDSRRRVSVAKRQALEDFYEDLDQRSEAELIDWRRNFASLIERVSKGELTSKNEQLRKHAAEAVGKLKDFLEEAKDLQELERVIQAPIRPLLTTPSLAVEGSWLALLIASLKIVEGILSLRRRRHEGRNP